MMIVQWLSEINFRPCLLSRSEKMIKNEFRALSLSRHAKHEETGIGCMGDYMVDFCMLCFCFPT